MSNTCKDLDSPVSNTQIDWFPCTHIPKLVAQLKNMTSTNNQHVKTYACGKHKHGGSRKKLTWEEKLLQLDDDVIRNFLCTASCGGECECVYKLLNMGEKGVRIVSDLREGRLAGTCLDICQLHSASSILARLHIFSLTDTFPTPGNCIS